jgi:hypothetical protein
MPPATRLTWMRKSSTDGSDRLARCAGRALDEPVLNSDYLTLTQR